MTTMSVRTFKSVAPLLPAETSVLLRADHGKGKSKIVRQAAKLIERHLKSSFAAIIDRRLSQLSEGDVIGLPSTDGEVTRFNPPDWYKKACTSPCILFLDELNRATPEVMQAAFQIVLDRELNGCKLHPQTRVFAAVNSSAAYNVNEIDPALLDRFWVIDLDPDTQDWIDWAQSLDPDLGGNIHPTVVDFIRQNDKWLDPPKNADPHVVHPSRRSWERLNNALVGAGLADNPQHELFYNICLGYIGTEASIKFHDFAKSVDNRITGEEIVNSYTKIKAKIARLGQERQNIAIDKAAEYIAKLDKVTDKQGENLKAFMKDLPGELRIAFWTKATNQGIDRLDLVKSIHTHCAEEVLGVFGVPMGEAGIGVVPNIPGIFKQPQQK